MYLIHYPSESGLPCVGDFKRLTYGPLQGLECEVIKVNNVSKVVVRIDSLQQNIIATVPAAYIADLANMA